MSQRAQPNSIRHHGLMLRLRWAAGQLFIHRHNERDDSHIERRGGTVARSTAFISRHVLVVDHILASE